MALWGGRDDAGIAPHLGASRTRLTLGTIQTAEALGSRREKREQIRGDVQWVDLPLPQNLVHPGGGTHPVTLHSWQTGSSWQTTGTLGEKGRR